MPRYNIALRPDDALTDSALVALAQDHYADVSESYILGAAALPHVTLCQFDAPDDEAARTFFRKSQIPSVWEITLTHFNRRAGAGLHEGYFWAEFLVARTNALLTVQTRLVSDLMQSGYTSHTAPETYVPHVTLARIRTSKYDHSPAVPVCNKTWHSALGHCDRYGVYQSDLEGGKK